MANRELIEPRYAIYACRYYVDMLIKMRLFMNSCAIPPATKVADTVREIRTGSNPRGNI